MTIQETYEQIIQRIRATQNQEKYHHLVNSPDKTEEEQMLHDNILKLSEYISLINDAPNSCNVPVDLLESGCRILIQKILKQLEQQRWDS